MLEQVGNMVNVNGTLIPAVNIQVGEGLPYYSEEHACWYGNYFEIMFEDGSLWVCSQSPFPDSNDLMVYVYPKWSEGNTAEFEIFLFENCDDPWDFFLVMYKGKMRASSERR